MSIFDKAIGALIEIAFQKQFKNVKQQRVCDSYTFTELMLPASDGARLHTFVFRPNTNDEKVPCIIERTCYPMMFYGSKGIAKEFCKRGYGYILQASRGTGGSEGKWEPNVNERLDGLDLIEYLCSQEWVGNIGITGMSYSALAGWAMADEVPDQVKSMYLSVYGCDRFTSAYSKGMFRHDVLTGWAMKNAGFKVKVDYLKSCAYFPQIEVDEKLWGQRVDWYRDWISHSDNSDRYWTEGFWDMLKNIPARVKIPVYITEGWFDHHLASALNSYNALPPETKKHTILQIGPWNHMLQNAVDGYKKSAKQMKLNEVQEKLNWFEQTLKRDEQPTGEIRYYHVGADEWRNASQYPFSNNGEYKFVFISSNGKRKLGQSGHGVGKVEFLFHPNNPVPSVGAESMLTTSKQRGSKLQPEPDYRPDVLSFVSEPL